MFWRLMLRFSLAVLAGVAIPALAVQRCVADPDLSAQLDAWLAGGAGAGVLVVVLWSAWITRRMTPALRDLAQAAERIGAGQAGERVFTEGGDVVESLGRSFNQMSEQLNTRIAALEEDREQLRTILSGMVEGVVALDADQRILFANDRAVELLEFSTRAPVGRRLWELVRRRPLLEIVDKALKRPEPCREELRAADGSSRSLTVHVARLPGSPPRGAVLVLHDTTELRRLERMRQEFVANVSHELKTPLTGIKLCAETLLAGAVEDPKHRMRFLDQIAAQSERLHTLILDLLSLARIESGDQLFEFAAIPVQTVLDACMQRHRPKAEARRQQLELTPHEGAPAAAVWADEEAVEQILDNLLDNALKYTPEGGHIRVGWGEENGSVWMQVADDGIGIPETDLPRIFERFYRVDKARSREMGGTGLGLAIVKHLSQAMKGSVQASSRVGRGATFTVRLPRASDEQV
jgi:two-component system, OmpR family, phosphate regulon sensor histidine kinase PhoR